MREREREERRERERDSQLGMGSYWEPCTADDLQVTNVWDQTLVKGGSYQGSTGVAQHSLGETLADRRRANVKKSHLTKTGEKKRDARRGKRSKWAEYEKSNA